MSLNTCFTNIEIFTNGQHIFFAKNIHSFNILFFISNYYLYCKS